MNSTKKEQYYPTNNDIHLIENCVKQTKKDCDKSTDCYSQGVSIGKPNPNDPLKNDFPTLAKFDFTTEYVCVPKEFEKQPELQNWWVNQMTHRWIGHYPQPSEKIQPVPFQTKDSLGYFTLPTGQVIKLHPIPRR